jgi:hypothetical protein
MLTVCGDASSCGNLFGPLACGLPVPGEKFVQLVPFGSPGDDALQYIGQIGLRIEIREFCCCDERCEDRPALGSAFAASEE